MNILDWVFQKLETREATITALEEFQRYLRPPSFVSGRDWFVQLTRAKYGEEFSGEEFKKED